MHSCFTTIYKKRKKGDWKIIVMQKCFLVSLSCYNSINFKIIENIIIQNITGNNNKIYIIHNTLYVYYKYTLLPFKDNLSNLVFYCRINISCS